MAEEVKRERTWGEAVEDTFIGGLKAVANGGGSRQFVAGALLGALDKENAMQERQTRENKAKLAELQVKEAEQNILNNQARYELLKLQEQELRAGQQHWVENEKNKSRKAAADAENAETTAGFNRRKTEEELKHLTAREQLKTESMEQNVTKQKQENAYRLIALRNAQEKQWNQDSQEHINKFKQNYYAQAGFNELNEQGKTVLEKSVAIQELAEVSALVYAKQRNEDEFKYLMSQTKGRLSDDGNSWISADGTRKYDLTMDNLKKSIAEIQKRADSDAKSAHVLGTQVRSLEQGAIKDVLLSPVVKAVFGDDSGGAYTALNDYINSQENLPNGTKVPRFDRKDKELHILARSLSGACFDGVVSEKERAGLIPLMGATLQQRGLDLEVGADIDHTYVVNRFGEKTPIKIFTRQLAQKDKISIGFNKHCADVAKQNQANTQAAQAKNAINEVVTSFEGNTAKLNNEKISELLQAKNHIGAIAAQRGVLVKNDQGKIGIRPDVTLSELKYLADIEKDAIKDIAPDLKGPWQRQYENFKAKEEGEKAVKQDINTTRAVKKVEEKVRKMSALERMSLMQPQAM